MRSIGSSLLVVLLLPSLFACSGAPSPGEGEGEIAFADLRVEDVTSTTAMVRFTTDVETSCEVEYGTAEDALSDTATDPAMDEDELSTEHDVLLESLAPETTYYWRGSVLDAEGGGARSDVLSFTTLSAENTGEENVALLSGGTVVSGVSSNFGGAANDETWGANRAFDALLSTEWATAGDGDDAWIEVTLPAARELHAVSFRSRKMTDGSSIISSFQITDGAGNVLAGPFDTPDPDTTYRVDVDPKVSASVVRVEAVTTSGGNAGVKEIQLLSPIPVD